MPGHNGTKRGKDLDCFVCPVDLRLPNECPRRSVTWDDEIPGRDLLRCGRSSEVRNYLDEEPLCRAVGREEETYRFVWNHSFGASALVRIGWNASKIVLRSRYQAQLFVLPPEGLPSEKALSTEQRNLLLEALAAARFWTLPAVDRLVGLDGADWTIEGRRNDKYRRWELWSPRDAFEQLGRTFFVLSGLPLSEL